MSNFCAQFVCKREVVRFIRSEKQHKYSNLKVSIYKSLQFVYIDWMNYKSAPFNRYFAAMHTLKYFYTFWIFEIYTIICSYSYYTQGLWDFPDFCGVLVIDQISKTISAKLLDQWAAAKLPQIVLLEQLVFRWQIYLPPGGY